MNSTQPCCSPLSSRAPADMREALWGFVQAGIAELHSPEHYLRYGHKHLERFLAASASEEHLNA